MKTKFNAIAATVFLTLLFVNMYTFISSIRLSDDINTFEQQTAIYKLKNQDLEEKIYKVDSLQHARETATSMNFTENTTPLYMNGPNYALKP